MKNKDRLLPTLLRLLIVGSAAISLSAIAGEATASAATGGGRNPPLQVGSDGAVFVQTDNPDGNQIVAYERSANGQLVSPHAYATGGDGAVAAGSAVDPLASQNSLVLADQGRALLAVNAGSGSVSVFRVSGSRLVLSEVIPSGGAFPVSIAVHGNLAYVLNSGGAGTVQGFSWFGDFLWPLWGSSRSLGLANTNPPFFLDSPGQIGFTPAGSQLVVTTKGSGSDIDVFAVGPFGLLSSQPVLNPAAAPVPFAFTFDAAGHIVVTEAGASDLTSYSVNPNGSITEVGSSGDGQAALCWVTEADGYFYGSNAGSANVSEFSESASGSPQLIGVAASTASGATDSAVNSDGHALFVENGSTGTVYAFQIDSGGDLVEIGSVSGLGSPIEGIAAS